MVIMLRIDYIIIVITCIDNNNNYIINNNYRRPGNMVIMLRINYAIIVIICFNNNCGRLQNLILLFKIHVDTRKNFLGICRKFGRAPSKMFVSPVIAYRFFI